ncbi:MAG TPA: PHP domain-containing protein, partial [Anaeromyxobacteraceae bacterium]|nr:PHP domain-containing protein [Anaeromyxobacteraceae bacterium]
MIRRAALLLLALAVLAFAAFGLRVRLRAAPRPPPVPGELRGAWHVHTTHSDGREPLAEVVRAARAAGLQFLVVTDHNVVHPEEAGWHDGVLVIEAHEASTRLGHLVAPGAPRALGPEERTGEPLQAIAALGGQAVLAHPFHEYRPFTGWGQEPWRGLEVVSNDVAFGEVRAGRATGRLLLGLATLPFDGGQAVAALVGPPARELAALDEA